MGWPIICFVALVFIGETSKCGKMNEYHEPEGWGKHSTYVWGREFGYEENKRTTCLCPDGQYIAKVAGKKSASWNLHDDGLDAISVICSGSDQWEKSMGYYDKKDVWADADDWLTTPDWGPICGLHIKIHDEKRYAMAFKFEYLDGYKSAELGEVREKYPGTWYTERCQKRSDTTRILVGFTITSDWTIYTFQPIWEFPKCEARAVRLNGLPQQAPEQWIKDLRNNAFLMIPEEDWSGGSPVYELIGESTSYLLMKSNAYPNAWRVKGTFSAELEQRVLLKIPYAYEHFPGYCFEELTREHFDLTQGFRTGGSALTVFDEADKRKFIAEGFPSAPIEYSKNSAIWSDKLSNNAQQWSTEVKNTKSNEKVTLKEHQTKFGMEIETEAKWDVGAKIGVSVGVETELSKKIGEQFKSTVIDSEGFKKMCTTDLRRIGDRADFVVWVWEFSRTKKYGQGTDFMLSCHSWAKSGSCQRLPPRCLPGGCDPPECIRCKSPADELMPLDMWIVAQKKHFGDDFVDQCLREQVKKCDPKTRQYTCCEELIATEGVKCGIGNGGCSTSTECVAGTTCKEMEGDNFGGPSDMSVCVTDHSFDVRGPAHVGPHLAESDLGTGEDGPKSSGGLSGTSVEVEAASGSGDVIQQGRKDEDCTEGISLEIIDREEKQKLLEAQRNWKATFVVPPQPDDQPELMKAKSTTGERKETLPQTGMAGTLIKPKQINVVETDSQTPMIPFEKKQTLPLSETGTDAFLETAVGTAIIKETFVSHIYIFASIFVLCGFVFWLLEKQKRQVNLEFALLENYEI